MNEPILKMHWERSRAHVDLDVLTAGRLVEPYTKDPIAHLTLLSEGCANTNYKVSFKNDRPPVVIRIYVRDDTAVYREVAIYELVTGKVPVARHLYFDDSRVLYQYPYSIMEWIEGTLLREVIAQKNEIAIQQSVFQAGAFINILRQITFAHGGFFGTHGQVRPFDPEEEYLPFVLGLLQNEVVKHDLGASLHDAVCTLVRTYAHIVPDTKEGNLTHADYDPANILVAPCDGLWKVAAILDWEFAFVGTYLLDIGQMLRYSHKLPDYYEASLVAGVQSEGFILPKMWKKQAKLMDLLCLLSLVRHNPCSQRPNINRDAASLIAHTVQHWDSFK